MKKIMSAALLIAGLAFVSFAQSGTPTPTPTPTGQSDTVKIATNLIQIDFAVTDQTGRPVADLRPDEVEVYENGERQKVTNLSFIASSRAVAERDAQNSKTGAPPIELRTGKVRRTIAFVIDDLSLSFESVYQTRRSLKKFVDEQMQDGDLVAIIRTGAGAGTLQQFTSDRRQLLSAIVNIKWNPRGNGDIGAFAAIAPSDSDRNIQFGDPTIPDATLQIQQQAEKDRIAAAKDFRTGVFANGTLATMKYIVAGMGGLPGRKTVILYSDGFKLLDKTEAGTLAGGRVQSVLDELVDQSNLSSVVIYTIDARGLQTIGLGPDDQIIANKSRELNNEIKSVNDKLMDRRDQLLDTQAGLDDLAKETGGFAVKNSNDLGGGIRRILDNQSYYLVSYEGDAESYEGVLNKVDIKVTRRGVITRYRSGFSNMSTTGALAGSTAGTPAQQLETALTSPFAANGIGVRLNALFGQDAAGAAYVRSLLHVNVRDLKFTDLPDGTKQAEFAVLAASFGDNGQPVDRFNNSYKIIIPAANLPKLLAEGFVYQFTFPMRRPGGYQFRVAIRDVQGQKTGSASQFVEVPDLKRNLLTVSSLVLESYTSEQWKSLSLTDAALPTTDPLTDTALRRVKAGTVLRYAFDVYNAKTDTSKRPSLHTRIRVFHDGKLVLDGKQLPLDLTGQNDPGQINSTGAITVDKGLQPGDYILQVIVTDDLAGPRSRPAMQFVQFEVIE